MSEPKPTTALATRPTTNVITTPDEYRAYLEAQRAKNYHILSPVVDVGALPPQWSLVASLVLVNPDPAAGEVYQDRLFCGDDEVALAKVAIRKILTAGGISVDTDRVDSGHVPHYWAFKATLSFTGLDGREKTHSESADDDMRDGAEAVTRMVNAAKRKGKSADAQVAAARLHGYRRCESRAIHAAARGKFGLKQKYTKAELARPFVIFNLVFQPDMTDPQQKAAVLAANLGAKQLLGYPPAAPMSHATDDVIDTTATTETVTAGPAQPMTEVPFDETEDDAPQGVLVAEVSKSPTTDDYFITTDIGRLHTSDRAIAKACNEARKAGTRIKLETEKKGDVLEILEVAGAAEKL
jgi:hypothetical protein